MLEVDFDCKRLRTTTTGVATRVDGWKMTSCRAFQLVNPTHARKDGPDELKPDAVPVMAKHGRFKQKFAERVRACKSVVSKVTFED